MTGGAHTSVRARPHGEDHMSKLNASFLRVLALGAAFSLAVTVLGLGAAAVPAAPSEPTISLPELQAQLDASPSGTVQGYFKTVLKGYATTRIPVTIQSIVPYYIPEGALIMFAASGPDIEKIGGIAQGMSGSPLFVSEGGADRLAGAVSYGDSFTTGYLGLATPVEYMATMEDTFMPAGALTSLSRAVTVAGRTVDQVYVAPSARLARAARPAPGTSVMAPLATMSIAGLPPRSAVYKDLVKRLAAHGLDVAPVGAGLVGQSAQAGGALDGGSALTVLFARGDMLYGAAGTVTWNDGGRVVAFGHPLFGIGDVQAYLTDGTVHGVWSSSNVPYKVISPGPVRGVFLQDRGTGIAGRIGAAPAEVPVTAAVTLQPQGVVGRGTSFVPQWVVTSMPGGDGPYIAAAGTGVAGYNASDNAMMAGSATTKTTVVVEDAAGRSYTVVRSNTWDDTIDVLGYLPMDAATMLAALVSDPDGVAPATVVSVDMTGQASPTHSTARIVDVRFPDGIRPGRSVTFQVVLNVYGQTGQLLLNGAFDVPAGASATGSVNVYPAATVVAEEGDPAAGTGTSGDGRDTVAERVAVVETLPTNDQLVVQFFPDSMDTDNGSTAKGQSNIESGSLEATVTVAGKYVTGGLQRRTGSVTVTASPQRLPYGGATTLDGTIAETDGATTVDIYTQAAGTAEPVKVATVPARADGIGGATFTYTLAGLKKNTRITADWAGDARALSASGTTRVTVGQSVKLTAAALGGGAVRLSALVLPGKAGQKVRFERRTGGSWTAVGTARAVTVPSGGARATLVWNAPAGTSTVRAVAAATTANAAGTSGAVTVRR